MNVDGCVVGIGCYLFGLGIKWLIVKWLNGVSYVSVAKSMDKSCGSVSTPSQHRMNSVLGVVVFFWCDILS